jgi:hypothetical protein
MQHKEYQGHNKCNVNESDGYMKCEKSKQPKTNQNCGEYPEHDFISLLLSASALMLSLCGRTPRGQQTSHKENESMSRSGHWRILISHDKDHNPAKHVGTPGARCMVGWPGH